MGSLEQGSNRLILLEKLKKASDGDDATQSKSTRDLIKKIEDDSDVNVVQVVLEWVDDPSNNNHSTKVAIRSFLAAIGMIID